MPRKKEVSEVEWVGKRLDNSSFFGPKYYGRFIYKNIEAAVGDYILVPSSSNHSHKKDVAKVLELYEDDTYVGETHRVTVKRMLWPKNLPQNCSWYLRKDPLPEFHENLEVIDMNRNISSNLSVESVLGNCMVITAPASHNIETVVENNKQNGLPIFVCRYVLHSIVGQLVLQYAIEPHDDEHKTLNGSDARNVAKGKSMAAKPHMRPQKMKDVDILADLDDDSTDESDEDSVVSDVASGNRKESMKVKSSLKSKGVTNDTSSNSEDDIIVPKYQDFAPEKPIPRVQPKSQKLVPRVKAKHAPEKPILKVEPKSEKLLPKVKAKTSKEVVFSPDKSLSCGLKKSTSFKKNVNELNDLVDCSSDSDGIFIVKALQTNRRSGHGQKRKSNGTPVWNENFSPYPKTESDKSQQCKLKELRVCVSRISSDVLTKTSVRARKPSGGDHSRARDDIEHSKNEEVEIFDAESPSEQKPVKKRCVEPQEQEEWQVVRQSARRGSHQVADEKRVVLPDGDFTTVVHKLTLKRNILSQEPSPRKTFTSRQDTPDRSRKEKLEAPSPKPKEPRSVELNPSFKFSKKTHQLDRTVDSEKSSSDGRVSQHVTKSLRIPRDEEVSSPGKSEVTKSAKRGQVTPARKQSKNANDRNVGTDTFEESSGDRTPRTLRQRSAQKKSVIEFSSGGSSDSDSNSSVQEVKKRYSTSIRTSMKKQTVRKERNEQEFTPTKATSKTMKSREATPKSSLKKIHLERTPKTPTSAKKTPKSVRVSLLTPSMPQRDSLASTPGTPLEEARARLHVSAVPQALPCRDQEFDNIYGFLEGKILDKAGGCMYISGVPGTGKTATVRQVVRALQEASRIGEVPKFNFVEVNGMKMTEPRQAYVQVLSALTGEKVTPDQALRTLEKRFTKTAQKKSTLLVVDELDLICNKRQDVVYNLLDWPSNAGSLLVVVTIANTMDLPETMLKGRVTSRLGLTRLTFKPYTFKQLQEIVAARLAGLDAFDVDAVQLVARKVASISGDARRALDICRRATEIAESEAASQNTPVTKGTPRKSRKSVAAPEILVTMKHVEAVMEEMVSSSKIQAIRRVRKKNQVKTQTPEAENEVERTLQRRSPNWKKRPLVEKNDDDLIQKTNIVETSVQSGYKDSGIVEKTEENDSNTIPRRLQLKRCSRGGGENIVAPKRQILSDVCVHVKIYVPEGVKKITQKGGNIAKPGLSRAWLQNANKNSEEQKPASSRALLAYVKLCRDDLVERAVRESAVSLCVRLPREDLEKNSKEVRTKMVKDGVVGTKGVDSRVKTRRSSSRLQIDLGSSSTEKKTTTSRKRSDQKMGDKIIEENVETTLVKKGVGTVLTMRSSSVRQQQGMDKTVEKTVKPVKKRSDRGVAAGLVEENFEKIVMKEEKNAEPESLRQMPLRRGKSDTKIKSPSQGLSGSKVPVQLLKENPVNVSQERGDMDTKPRRSSLQSDTPAAVGSGKGKSPASVNKKTDRVLEENYEETTAVTVRPSRHGTRGQPDVAVEKRTVLLATETCDSSEVKQPSKGDGSGSESSEASQKRRSMRLVEKEEVLKEIARGNGAAVVERRRTIHSATVLVKKSSTVGKSLTKETKKGKKEKVADSVIIHPNPNDKCDIVIDNILKNGHHKVMTKVKKMADKILAEQTDLLEFYERRLAVDLASAAQLCVATAQQEGDLWQEERKVRITASRCYGFFTHSQSKCQDWAYKIDGVLRPRPFFNFAMRNGVDNEHNARVAYARHVDRNVVQVGLVVNPVAPWLGCSPDGVVVEDGVPVKLLEIKCPLKGIEHTADYVSKNTTYYCKIRQGLRKRHPYYGQMQLGMALTGLRACDFVIYSPFDDTVAIEEIPYDEEFATEMITAVTHVFFDHMLPYLVDYFDGGEDEDFENIGSLNATV